jgi:putative transposase
VGWQETSVDERLRFIEECKSQEWSIAEVCRRFEISRKTGYKWLARYELEGLEGLKDRSHAPHHNPRQVLGEVEEGLVDARGKHPHWGPVKLRAWLQRTSPEAQWPAASTIGEILHRHGLAIARKRRPKISPKGEPSKLPQGPNLVWLADLKDWFGCQDGSRCNALILTDAYSQFLLRCQALKQPDAWHSRLLFEAAFREYGLPQHIRSASGAPFVSLGIGRLSELSVWWIKLGIRPEIEPDRSTQEDRNERMRLTLRQETARPPRANLREQQKAFDRFCREYNYEKPNEALQGRTPAECYQASARPYPSRVRELAYPADYEVRYVSDGGQLRWKGAKIFIGRSLAGEPLGLEFVTDAKWRVWFSFYELGIFDEEKLLIRPMPA